MLLVHLSGHSGAGKSRLLNALEQSGLVYHRHVLYTSRQPRSGEIDARDYHFRSAVTIKALPRHRFIVYPVRNMIQAVDLDTLEQDLRSNSLVIVEMFHAGWPPVRTVIMERLGRQLKTLSVFLTAVNPYRLMDVPREEAEATIRESVRRCLAQRGRDEEAEINLRADSAVEELFAALGEEHTCDRIILSAPEGRDGQDNWTRDASPAGQAAQTLKEFLSLVDHEIAKT